MKTKFWTVAVALLAIVLSGSAVIYAQQNDGGGARGWKGHRGHMGQLARELNLTDAQKQQIKTIFQTNRAQMRPLMQQMMQNREAMLNATAGGAFDQAKVTAIANQQAQIMSQLAVQKASLRSQIYNRVLTADQKAKADQLLQAKVSRINQRLQKFSDAGAQSSTQ